MAGIQKVIAVIGVLVLVGLGMVACDPPRDDSPARLVALTATRAPAPTPLPCPTNAEAVYFRDVAQWAEIASEGVLAIGNLSGQAARDIALVVDENWQLEVLVVLTAFYALHNEIDQVAAPASVRDIHRDMEELGDLMVETADYYAEGIDNIDADLIAKAVDNFDRITAVAVAAARSVENFCG